MLDNNIKRKNRNHLIILIISGILCLILSLFTGIKINTQSISDFNTFSGGLPFTWIELYYSKDMSSIWDCLNKFQKINYKFDFFVLFANFMIIKYIINKIINLV